MDVDTPTGVAAAGTGQQGSARTVLLHPLVVINVSDHYTRLKAQSGGNPGRVFGVLIGKEKGRTVEITNSFETTVKQVDGKATFDLGFMRQRADMSKQVFPDYDVLGWYSTGEGIIDGDLSLHHELATFNETPIYLLLNPNKKDDSGISNDLPIEIHESSLVVIEGKPTEVFTAAEYKIEPGEAERIAVDTLAHAHTAGSSNAAMLVSHLSSLSNTIAMLRQRVSVIVEFLKQTKAGEMEQDHTILRTVSALCAQLPAMDAAAFTAGLTEEYTDVQLVAYMASVTKATAMLDKVADKFGVINTSKRGASGRFGHGVPYGMGSMAL